MNELLPCPFCAGSAEFRTSTSGTQQWIRCVNPECDAFGPFARTQAEARAKWNERVANVEIARLRGWLQKIVDGPYAESHHRWAAQEALKGEQP